MPTEKKYKRLLSNTAIVGVGTLGSKLLVYLLVRLYTSILTNEEYSIASNIADMATLLIPIVSLGVGEAVFRFAMDKEYRKNEVFTLGFLAVGLGSLLLLPLGFLFSHIAYFRDYVWLLIVYVLASAIHTNCSQFIRARAQFKLYAFQGILNTLFTIGCNLIFLIPLKMGVVGYVLSVAVADLLSSLFIFIAGKLWREFTLTGLRKSSFKAMLLYSLPLIPTTISWWVTNVSDRYMITFMKSDAVNGLYAAAYKIPTLLMVLIGIFNSAWKYSAVSERDRGEGALFFTNVYRGFLSVLFCVSGGIVAFSKVLSHLMFGPDFRSAWIYIPVLTLAMAFSALSSFTGTIFIVEKKSRYSLYTALVAALLNLLLNFLLIPLFTREEEAAMGAALATLVAYFFMYLFRLVLSGQLIGYDPQLLLTFKNLVLVVGMALVMTLEIRFWILWQGVGLLLLLLVNRRVLADFLRNILPGKKKERAE